MRVPLCGDPAVGKTSLVRTLATGDFSQEEFDTSVPVEVLNGKLTLVDTNGQEDNDRMRGVAYKDADAFLVLFSVISPTSYNSVLTKVCSASE
jgi:small GTP-binding protein